MIVKQLFHAFAAAILAVATATASAATEPSSSALTLVKGARLGNNLPGLAMQVAKSTVTYKSIESSVGTERAKQIVQEEIDKARPAYQEQWDKNLAASYAETLSAEELESLAGNPKSSPYVSKMLANQGAIGQRMQAKSSGLLAALLSEALNKAFAKITHKQ